MPDRSTLHRRVARECLELAQRATDPSIRAVLVGMAERSLARAGEPEADDSVLNELLREYNDRKMRER